MLSVMTYLPHLLNISLELCRQAQTTITADHQPWLPEQDLDNFERGHVR